MSEEDRWNVIFCSKHLALKPVGIARTLKRTPKAVYDILEKYEQTGTVHDRPGRGRKPIYSETDIKKIVGKAKQKKKAPQIAREMGERSCPRTIQRILRSKGLFYRKVKKIEKLSEAHKQKRVSYCKEMKKENWGTILFSDEKKFQLGSGTEYAWQDPDDRMIKEYVLHAPKLNVWGAIGSYTKTPLYFFEENMDSALYQQVLEQRITEENIIYAPDTPKSLMKKWRFLQDGARAHTAKSSMKVIEELIGNRLHKHPAKSPDLNPIEDIWSYLDRKVIEAKITTIASLKKKLKKEWDNLPWAEIKKSVDSMKRRIQTVEECGGGRTDY
jgi:transposase